ncbi:SusC/RagA family TonB-linked outer membrane protein [Rhizosphaericola mali]|uniref:SusC/RagA family TonB-linked outer membrane protein n=1 Tax=Rhizosphaericola mali TaxID=2545455 RepID=A0A5P2G7H2_9BACT|nr:SusC/RagA family TonB-linked outer membrane protein [Rhizosphaericola mali]QES90229.1 SusC/RagA family TonB-linked outer membrane protein [Rhizosphaericola mali]
MKKTTFYLLLFIFSTLALKSYAQKITFAGTNIPVQKFFNAVREQTGYTVFGNYSLLENFPSITVDVKDKPLNEALKDILAKNNLTYSIEGKMIVLTEINNQKNQENHQVGIFSGMVVDEDGKPVEGASVMNMMNSDRKNNDVVTDAHGSFTIQAKKGDMLNVYYVGYKIYKFSIFSMTYEPSFQLTPTNKTLEETVVIGYGTARKKDLTGSVAVVDPNSFKDLPLLTVDNALAGKAAGVEVTKSDGTPGGAVRIRIRGSSSLLGGNDPLYVIDGIPIQPQSNFINPGYDVSTPSGNYAASVGGSATGMSTGIVNGVNSLNGLNPDDIESMTVLKDASATAIYGSKAANGVVIITTKRGRKNSKPSISFNYYTTLTTPKLPHLLNADQYKELVTEAAQNSYDARKAAGYSITTNIDEILNNPDNYFGNNNTNWLHEITHNTLSHNAELSVQGGGENSRYYSSISYNSTPGAIKGSSFDRIAGKINLENNISSKFSVNTNLLLGYSQQNITNGAFSQAIAARPDWSPYDAAGNFVNFSTMGATYDGFLNPVAMLKSINSNKTLTLLGSLGLSYRFTNDLLFKSVVSLDRQSYNQRTFTPSFLSTGGYVGAGGTTTAIGSNGNSTRTNWFIENTMSYVKSFKNKSDLNILVGQSYQTTKNSFFSATASGYPDNYNLTSLSSAVTPLYVKGDDPLKPQSYLLSFYLRSNYSLMDKYIFTFTGRTDGSSKFGTNNKWGYFPSGAFAWRISNENFLKNVTWIEDIKLRASYGLTGNQNIGDQMYRTLYSPYNYGGQSALVPTQLGNDGIKWESSKQFDGGADVSMFKGRLQLMVDYYDKRNNGALLSLPVAPSTSFSSLLSNAVGIKNRGWELSVNGDILKSKNFTWSGSWNISWNKSLVTKLDADASLGQLGNLTGVETGNTTLIKGQPIGLITGSRVTGIIKTQDELNAYKEKLGWIGDVLYPFLGIGDPMFSLTETGGFTDINRSEIIAHGAPKYYGGFSQSLSYKNISLQAYFTYSYGGQLLWADHVASVEFVGQSNANVAILGRYNANNTNSNQPRLLYGNDGIYSKTNLDVFSSSYLKLRTLSVNYNFSNTSWSKKMGIKGLSAYLSAMNLFTITKYPGNDPETSNDPYSAAGGYFDISNYPSVKTYSVGIKASF